MKKIILIIAACFPILMFGQTIDEYKAIVDSQKVASLIKIGEEWSLIRQDTSSCQKYYGDSIWFTTSSIPPSIDSIVLQNKWINGDTTYLPVRNGCSFKTEYLYSGVINYKQLVEKYTTVYQFRNDGKALNKWLKKAKKDKVKKKDFLDIGNYIIGK